MLRALSISVVVMLGCSIAFGCEAIAGIEDRVLAPLDDSDASNPASSTQCKAYCSDALENCRNEYTLYASEETCLATCALLPAGEEGDDTGNTVTCRARNAKLAGQTGEPNVHCPRASPGGDGICGDNCASYCMLFEQVCPDDVVGDCERKCGALYVDDDPKYDVFLHHDDDYMQCRLVHLTSATVDPDTHCWHSTITPGPNSPCADRASIAPDCDRYCDTVMVACEEEHAVYESKAQCLSVCGALELGSSLDKIEDTVGCRRYHSYNSLEAPEAHCSHASPSGDGHCGEENCTPYCRLLQAACPEDFAAKFETEADCQEDCAAIDGAEADSGYSVMTASGSNTVQCRLLNVSRAFSSPSACAAAVGGGECL